MASKGTISGSGMTASWKINYQSIESNATSITVNYVINHDVVSSPTTAYGTISAGGVSKYFSVPIYPGTSTATVGSITAFVYHNTDGTGGARIKGDFNISGVDSGSCNGWVQFDTIPRQATILSADNFTDEENPTITYSNPAGDTVEGLQACISFDGLLDDIAYRDIPIDEVAYTFELTEAERAVLRANVVGSNTATVYFVIMTILGGEVYYSSLAKTITIVGTEPHLEPTVEDGNEKTYALTGDRNIFVKYFSQAVYYIDASATKGAELVETKVVCGAKSNTSMAGSIDNVESGTFIFSATDNRGNTTIKTVEKPFVEYVKLTCNLSATPPTTEGKATINISGNYFIGNFGGVANSLSLMYRIKEDDGDWGSWRSTSATPANGTYKTTVNITGLDYQKKWSFQARALDKLMIVDSASKTVKTTPIFDWSENDFNFNVPISWTDNKTVYSLSGLAKAMSNAYLLETTGYAGANYSSASFSNAVLLGNNLRCYFTATRSEATGAGNIANEVVATVSINHGGKIKSAYVNSFGTGSVGSVASFVIANATNDGEMLTFDISLTATATASTEFSAYFLIPVVLDLNAY